MTAMNRDIRSYVLRRGRMTSLQRRSLATLSGGYCIPFSDDALDFAELFPGRGEVIVEVGFGMGDATAQIAAENPAQGFLGIEVFEAGVGKLLSQIERRELCNVKIVVHDAQEVLAAMVADRSLAGVHIFFPDPWPKKRHHKRRLIQPSFARLVAEKLRPGGYLYVVTDWEDYAEQILAVLGSEALLANRYDGYAPRQEWRPETSFERKSQRKNHLIREVYFVRRDV